MNKEWFFEMESTPGEGAVKIVEMTTRDLEYYIHLKVKYYINLVDEAVAGFERIAVLKEVPLWVKCCQAALHVTEMSFVKGRVN